MTDETKKKLLGNLGRSLFSPRTKIPSRSHYKVPSSDALNLRSRVIELESENNILKNKVNMLYEENLMLNVQVDNIKDKMKRLFDSKKLRMTVRQGALDKKYRDEREEYINKMRDDHPDLDIGTFTEENLVYGDPNIPQNRPVSVKPDNIEVKVGGYAKKKKKTRRRSRKKRKSKKK
jgi:hypothetical protein